MIHQLAAFFSAVRFRSAGLLLAAALSGAVAPAHARDCLDYASYGGPHGDPPLGGGLLLAGDALDLAVQGGHAYLACGAAGMQVVELSVPTAPVWVGEEPVAGFAAAIAAWGDHAVLGVGSTLRIIDITSAPDPVQLQSLSVGGVVRDVTTEGSLVLASADSAGVVVFDLEGPDPLATLGAVQTSMPALSAAASDDGSTAWVATAAGVEIVSLDGGAPALLGTLVTGRAMSVVVRDGDVLWAASDDGVLIAVDVAEPRTPREFRRHTLPTAAVGLHVEDGFAYVAGDDGLLRIAGVGRRGTYVPLGTLPTPGDVHAVRGVGPYLMMADGAGGIQVGWRQCDLALAVGPAANPRARLLGAVPNPLNPGTTVVYSLESPTRVRISLHDARGRTAAVLLDEDRPRGSHGLEWNGRLADGTRAASGVWYVRMEAGGRVETRALTLLR